MFALRDATAEDALEVAGVHVRSWQVAYRGLIADEFLDALDPQERARRYDFGSNEPAAPRTILAIDSGTIAGFATIGASRDQDAPGLAELMAIYVDPPAAGRGVGRRLMGEAYAGMRALGFTESLLWLLRGNQAAERFYRADAWLPDGSSRVENVWGIESEVFRYRRELG